MQPSVALRAAAAALLLAACDSSTGPEPLTGAYVARSVDGRPMPAVVDSVPWNDGSSRYTLYRLGALSVEFLDDENALYTVEEWAVAYVGADSASSGRCTSFTVPYRRENGRVLLVVEPALMGRQGRLRLDTLNVQGDAFVQTVRAPTGKTAQAELVRSQQPETCS